MPADEAGVYGYLPRPGSRYDSPNYDFSDAAFVSRNRDIRIGYLNSSDDLELAISAMRVAGADAEQVATRVVLQRNSQKMESRALMLPDEVAVLERGNMKAYGNPVGPTPAQLFNKYGDWEIVIEKSMQKDPAINMLLGLPARR